MSETIDQAVGEIQSAPETFSSWDRCMSKQYCKIPVIVGIVVASLILLSIIWCIVRCCCCGLSCCCGCLSCFNSCCPGPRGKKDSKHRDDAAPGSPYPPPNPYMGYVPPSNPSMYNGPNTATFNVGGRPANSDSLPRMPTWKDGKLQDDNPASLEAGQGEQFNGVAPLGSGGRTRSGGYSDISGQYRGADTTNPYGSDLGTQSFVSQQNSVYQTPPPSRSPVGGYFGGVGGINPHSPRAAAGPEPTLPNLQPPNPPGTLQVGRRPMDGSMREV